MENLCINCKGSRNIVTLNVNEFGDWVCRRFNEANDGDRKLCMTCSNDLFRTFEREMENVPGPSNAGNVPTIENQALGIDESSGSSDISLFASESLLYELSPSRCEDVDNRSNDSSPSPNDVDERVESSETSPSVGNASRSTSASSNSLAQHQNGNALRSTSASSSSLAQHQNGNSSRSTSDSAEH